MRDESLFMSIVKHPFIWGGTGLLIRYYDQEGAKATTLKAVGIVGVVGGLAHALFKQQQDPVKLLE